MKHKSTRIALRWFFRVQIVCLCVTLAGVGVCVAASVVFFDRLTVPFRDALPFRHIDLTNLLILFLRPASSVSTLPAMPDPAR